MADPNPSPSPLRVPPPSPMPLPRPAPLDLPVPVVSYGSSRNQEMHRPPQPTSDGRSARTRMQDAVEVDFDLAVESLNRRINAAIESLAAVPGKTEVGIPLPSERGITFIRLSDKWSLLFQAKRGDSSKTKEWHKCSVEEKSIIAQALPSLLEAMLATSAGRKAALKSAHDGMDRFEAMLKQQKEGA